jgi:Na+/melibiose symporter-like transporter
MQVVVVEQMVAVTVVMVAMVVVLVLKELTKQLDHKMVYLIWVLVVAAVTLLLTALVVQDLLL